MRDIIEDAQHRLIQALGELMEARKKAEDSDCQLLAIALDTEIRSINETDNRLGKLKREYNL